MASLLDFYQPPQGIPAFMLGSLALRESRDREDTALGQSNIMRQYQQRELPALVNRYAGRGTFFGGGARLARTQLEEDRTRQIGEMQRLLARQLGDYRRQRIGAAMGQELY